MADDDPVTRVRDGRRWRIGTDADVAWIVSGTSPGLTITSAIPPVFEAYATLVLPDNDQREHDRAIHPKWWSSSSPLPASQTRTPRS